MFTGIIEEIGSVKKIVKGNKSIEITIECKKIMDDINLGDSIAVNGICLTVTDFSSSVFTADVMPETMRKTNLGRLNVSDKVNLERALKLSDRLGGHIVSGHVDGTGVVTEIVREDNAIWLTIKPQQEVQEYIVLKGSVTIDGASLTVAYVDQECFKLSLIPLTAGITILGLKKIGDEVNVECDVIAKYVEKLIFRKNKGEDKKTNITMDFLRDNGFA